MIKRYRAFAMVVLMAVGLLLLCMGLARNGSTSVAAPGVAPVATIRVCTDGPPSCDYASLQAAVDAAVDGDVIQVAQGTYTGPSARAVPPGYFRGTQGDTSVITQVVYITKNLTIRGGYTLAYSDPPDPDAYPTILDAEGRARVVMIAGQVSATLEGLQIAGGDASGLGGHAWAGGSDAGGGVHIMTATATIRDCKIHDNVADFGGGVFVHYGPATIASNDIYSNTANWGGGVSLSQSPAIVISNTISSNVVNQQDAPGGSTVPNRGAGVDLVENSDAHVAGNIIVDNTAGQEGGGLAVQGGAATIEHNTIEGNSAGRGGGLHLVHDEAHVAFNVITANVAVTSGGGLDLEDSSVFVEGNDIHANDAKYGGGAHVSCTQSPDESHASFYENDFVANTANDVGGGIATEFCANTVLVDNLFSTNSAQHGGGIQLFISDTELRQNTITGNSADWGGGIYMHGPGSPELVNTLVADNQANGGGSGLYILGAYPRLWHTTVARNSGGDGSGIFVESWTGFGGPANVAMTNTIVSSHTVGIGVTGGNTVTLGAVLWHNTPITISQAPTAVVSVQDQMTGDPNFQNPGVGDFHLGNLSDARDTGMDVGVPQDLDGEVRPMGWGADLGADEYPDAAFTIVHEPSSANVNRGQTFAYDIVVTNDGEAVANNVVLTAVLSIWQRPIDVTPAGTCAIVDSDWGGTVVCGPLDLPDGSDFNVSLDIEVSDTAALGQEMINTVVARADETMNGVEMVTYAQDCHARINDAPTDYVTVQAAVDAAAAGDLVKVAGYCVGVVAATTDVHERPLWQQVYLTKTLTIRGGYNASDWSVLDPDVYPTTLDALGRGRVVYVGAGLSVTLENLGIVGGDARGLEGTGWGEGVGGGVLVLDAAITLKNVELLDNTAFSGGGLWLEMGTASLDHSTFSNNTAEFCGGLRLGPGTATLSGNIIRANATSFWSGGGMCIDGNAATLRRNVIADNSAARSSGGLLVMFGSDVALVNNVIVDNQAGDGSGSALRIIDSSAIFLHNTVARNSGGDGSGIFVQGTDPGSTVDFVNTVLVSHSVGISVTGGNTVTIDGVLWYDTPLTVSQAPTAAVTVQNEGVGDPRFDADGYHLMADSPAKDVGVTTSVQSDIDLDLRPIGDGFDLGADEVRPPSATAEPAGGTLVFSDTAGLTTTLDVPTGAVSETTTIVYTPKSLEALEGAPSGLAFGGRAFELEAYQKGTLVLEPHFGKTITLVMRYIDADVADVLEDTLVPFRWTGSAWEEIGTRPGEGYLFEPDVNRLTLYLLSFTRFGQFGVGVTRRLYLPLVLKDG